MNIAYMRVSTSNQDNNNQLHKIKEYCSTRNIKINKNVEIVISSRKNSKQREIDSTLKLLKENDKLIVSALDRLGRSTIEVMTIIKDIQKKGIELHLIRESLVIGKEVNAVTTMFLTVISAMAEMEKNLISERTKASLTRLKSQGVKLGRNYKNAPATSMYDVHQEAIKEMLLNGSSITSITKTLGIGSKQSLSKYIKKHSLK